MKQAPGGFAVLIILWMLALLALIADRMIVVGRSEVRIADNLRAAATAEAAADGAVFEGIYRLGLPGPGGWKIDGRPRHVRIGRQDLGVRVEDERMTINLNAAPAPLLQALLQQVGMPSGLARIAGERIVATRVQVPSAAAPSAGPFRTLGQLAAVPGIGRETAALLASHLTLDDSGGVAPGPLDPIVAAALRQAPPPPAPAAAKPVAAQQKKPETTRTVTIRAVVDGVGASSFERDAVVRLGGPSIYRILSWRADRDV